MKAFDLSRYSTGNKPVSDVDILTLRDTYRCQLGVVGLWHGLEAYDAAHKTLVGIRSAGMLTAGYIALSPSRGGAEQVALGKAIAGDEWPALNFVAIDVEVDGVTVPQIREALDAVQSAGQRPIVYTAKWYWTGPFGDSTAFANYPLWDAYYDNDPTPAFNHPYGGWTMASLVGDQFTNTTNVGSIAVDFNIFSDDFVQQVDPPTDFPGAMAKLTEAWRKDMADLAVNAADLIQTPLDVTRLALHDLYTQIRDAAWKALLNPGK